MSYKHLLEKGALSQLAAATAATHATSSDQDATSVATVATVAPAVTETSREYIEKQIKLSNSEKRAKKKLLGHRVQILRVLIRRFLNDHKCREMVNYKGTVINDSTVEKYLDDELMNFGYDLEGAIDLYRIYTPPATYPLLCKCGYRPPFCACGNTMTT